jgi:hypothetical protein
MSSLGVWQLETQNFELGSTFSIVQFEVEITFIDPTRVEVNATLDLAGQHRVTGLRSPVDESDATTKRYVQESITDSLSVESALLRAELAALNPSYPNILTYRWQAFETYDIGSAAFLFSDDAALFGGVTPSAWSNNNATAADVTTAGLNTLLNREGRGGASALMVNDRFPHTDDNNGRFFIVHFQVENTTNAVVVWPLTFSYSAYDSGGQRTSIAQDQTLIYQSDGVSTSPSSQNTILVNIQPESINDFVIVVSGSLPSNGYRHLLFAFVNDTLALPEGVRFRATWR